MDTTIYSGEVIALPQFAPLPTSFILNLLRMEAQTFVSLWHQSTERLRYLLTQLEAKVNVAKQHIAQRMQEQSFSRDWQDALKGQINAKQPHGKVYSVSKMTVAAWHRNHILPVRRANPSRYLDRCAAILIAAMVDPRKQGFAPTVVDPSEPQYWVYGQHGPNAPIAAYPIDREANLPSGTLLWTSWPTIDPNWTQFDPWGSMRFSSIDRPSLARWDTTLTNRDMSLLFEDGGFFGGKMQPAALTNAANQVLFRMAPTRLSPSTQVSLPFVLSPNEFAQRFS